MSYIPVPDFVVSTADYIPVPDFDESEDVEVSRFLISTVAVAIRTDIETANQSIAIRESNQKHINISIQQQQQQRQNAANQTIAIRPKRLKAALNSLIVQQQRLQTAQQHLAVQMSRLNRLNSAALIASHKLSRASQTVDVRYSALNAITQSECIATKKLARFNRSEPIGITPLIHAQQSVQIIWGIGAGHREIWQHGYYPVIPLLPRPFIYKGNYIMLDTLYAYTDSNDEILLERCKIYLDKTLWAWSLDATVLGTSAITLIKPTPAGVQNLHIDINGYTFTFIVEELHDNRAHGSQSFTIRGRSRIAYLSAPFAPVADYLQSQQWSAQQLIDNHLNLTGFTANFNITDWLIAAEVLTYSQLSPIQAIGKIATATGAIIIPDKSLDQININYDYTNKTWNWPSLIGTLPVIDDDMIRAASLRYQPGQTYNGVYVSGTNTGVNDLIRRTGTAADKLAKTYIDDLIVHDTPATQKGIQILSESGNKGIYDFELPLLQPAYTPSLYNISELLEFNHDSENFVGKLLSITLIAERKNGALVVTQNLSIERSYD